MFVRTWSTSSHPLSRTSCCRAELVHVVDSRILNGNIHALYSLSNRRLAACCSGWGHAAAENSVNYSTFGVPKILKEAVIFFMIRWFLLSYLHALWTLIGGTLASDGAWAHHCDSIVMHQVGHSQLPKPWVVLSFCESIVNLYFLDLSKLICWSIIL